MSVTKDIQSGSQLRQMGEAELARLGEESLRSHIIDQAIVAHGMYAPADRMAFEKLLSDRRHVRYPVELLFDIGPMAPHQFAHVEIDVSCYRLYVHPRLKDNSRDFVFAASYFIPVINFGNIINDDHCILYGATFSGITIDAYYSELCRIAGALELSPRNRE